MNLKIEKIISSGDGIGWTDGKTFFAPYTIPGEEIRILKAKKDRSFYRVEQFELISESKWRRDAVCPSFGLCGGCMFLHVDYEYQKEIKKSILKELFAQKKLKAPDEIEFISPGEFGVRTRAKVTVEKNKPSFKKRFSHKNIPFDNCPLIHPELNKIISKECKKEKKEAKFSLNIQTVQRSSFQDMTP